MFYNLLSWFARMRNVFMLHRVLPKQLIPEVSAYTRIGTMIALEYLEEWITRQIDEGCVFVTVSQPGCVADATGRREIALTFDDGYADGWEYVVPLLLKYGITATFYPVTGPCRDNSVLPIDRYYHFIDQHTFPQEKREDFIAGKTKREFYYTAPELQMNWLQSAFRDFSPGAVVPAAYLGMEQLHRMAQLGFEIGSHSDSHALFTAGYMNSNRMQYELNNSKKWLEEVTGKAVHSFCFPAGKYTAETVREAARAGYKNVCLVSRNSPAEVYELPAFERIPVSWQNRVYFDTKPV